MKRLQVHLGINLNNHVKEIDITDDHIDKTVILKVVEEGIKQNAIPVYKEEVNTLKGKVLEVDVDIIVLTPQEAKLFMELTRIYKENPWTSLGVSEQRALNELYAESRELGTHKEAEVKKPKTTEND